MPFVLWESSVHTPAPAYTCAHAFTHTYMCKQVHMHSHVGALPSRAPEGGLGPPALIPQQPPGLRPRCPRGSPGQSAASLSVWAYAI